MGIENYVVIKKKSERCHGRHTHNKTIPKTLIGENKKSLLPCCFVIISARYKQNWRIDGINHYIFTDIHSCGPHACLQFGGRDTPKYELFISQ